VSSGHLTTVFADPWRMKRVPYDFFFFCLSLHFYISGGRHWNSTRPIFSATRSLRDCFRTGVCGFPTLAAIKLRREKRPESIFLSEWSEIERAFAYLALKQIRLRRDGIMFSPLEIGAPGEEKSTVSGNKAVFRGSVQFLWLLFSQAGKVTKGWAESGLHLKTTNGSRSSPTARTA